MTTRRGGDIASGYAGRPSAILPPSTFTARESQQVRRLVVVMLITSVFFVLQLAGAVWADSDVLRLEAVHVLTDVAALGLAALAMRVAVRRPTARFTFGLRRVEPVTAIFNALLVLLATALLVKEAAADLSHEGGPLPDRMLVIAALGLVVNGISAWLIHGAIGHGHHAHGRGDPSHDAQAHGAHLHGHDAQGAHGHDAQGPHAHAHDAHGPHAHAHGHDDHGHRDHAPDARDAHAHGGHLHAAHEHGARHDLHGESSHGAPAAPCEDYDHHHIAHHGHGHVLNLRGAWLHLFGDALGSLAAIIAAIAIRCGASPKVDALASFVVAGILVLGAARLLYDAVLILLEASPPHLSVKQVRTAILATEGVTDVHELHVWTLGAGHDAISAHVGAKVQDLAIASRVEAALRQRFSVEYVTIQVEAGGVTCQAESLES